MIKEPESWMEELAQDSRTGVQNALSRWKRQYEKAESYRTQSYAERSV